MTLSSEQIKIALEIWHEYCRVNVTFINANQETTPDEIDEQRYEAIPKIKAKIDEFLGGEIPLEEFKTTVDGLNKRNRLWGFQGINGQMFFNMLTKTCIQHNKMEEFNVILKQSLPAPKNIDDAEKVINQFRAFTETLGSFHDDRRSAPKVGSIPFFLSYFWQIEDPDKFPVYYTSAVSAFSELGIWSPSRDVVKDYLAFFQLILDLQNLFSKKVRKKVSLWEVEHVFWYYNRQEDAAEEVVETSGKVKGTTTPELATLPESYIPPVVSILPRLANHDPQMVTICEKSGRSIDKVFEERIAILFQMLGYEVEPLGQGYGRVPDGIALSPEFHYAIIYDAKVRKDGYTMGTDERAIKEYIWRQVEPLKRKGTRNNYFMIVSSQFSGDHDDVIRRLKIETDVREVLLVEVGALLTLLEGKLKSTTVTLGPEGFQNLLASSGVLTKEDVKEFLGI